MRPYKDEIIAPTAKTSPILCPMKPDFSYRLFLTLSAFSLLGISGGCGGGSSSNLPNPAPVTPDANAQSIARWQPIVSADASAVEAPPFAGTSVERDEIAQLLALQNARTPAQIAAFNKWNNRAATQWNILARDLVTQRGTVPPLAARIYAALSVAQYDATIAAARAGQNYRRATPTQTDARIVALAPVADGYPSRTAALCQASADVLKSFYPADDAEIESERAECKTSRLSGGVSFPSDLEAGAQIGGDIAAKTVARIATDGTDKAAQSQPKPIGPGVWPGENGLLPSFKLVRPWLTSDITQFRAVSPPAFGSPQFNADLAEVRQISDNRTPQQSQIAEFWADAAQTFTPPGHWNLFAQRIIASHNLTDAQATRVYALMNMAEQNAGIAAWDAKYTYWVIRPSQADPNITTPVGLPNFPSYVSGHSTFSGAASRVLGALFPDQKAVVDALAEEASVSRIYGGIHYRFDADNGITIGRRVADLSVARSQDDGYNGGVPSGRTLSVDELKRATDVELQRVAPGLKRRSMNGGD